MNNDENRKILDVCIVGDGFSGLNCARLLAKKSIKCEIFSKGYGASQLWVGTFDFLNYEGGSLQNAYSRFINDFPDHPYKYLSYDEVKQSFNEFFQEFPGFNYFLEHDNFVNKQVLTLIGNLKPCIGIWHSIFNEFDELSPDTIILLIDFHEFNNSAMYLFKKGLESKYESIFSIVKLSFTEVLTCWGIGKDDKQLDNLSDFRIGNFFDSNYENLRPFCEYLQDQVKKSYPDLEQGRVKYILFPPILGIDKNSQIIKSLGKLLGIPCREVVAFSPSLMSKRLMKIFDSKIDSYSITRNKRLELVDLKIAKNEGKRVWQLIFKNSKGDEKIIFSNYVIFAIGSVFKTGLFESKHNLELKLKNLDIQIPNNFSSNFEIQFSNGTTESGLFACGAASYVLCENLDDDLEIKYGAGLGLAISTSFRISNYISDKVQKEF
jgi:anaerobic glycerol-3-phosphate dehydrogenase